MRKVTWLLSWVVAMFATPPLYAQYTNPLTGSVPDEIRKLVDLHTHEADLESVIPARMAAGQTGYLIVTTRQIKANLKKLNAFIAHKKKRGFTVTVITEDDYGNTALGQDRAAAIRAWMHKNYQSHNLLYALMIGNPNEKKGDVPYHLTDSTKIPSDYPYSDLTGATWDLNGDGIFGENNDIGKGGADGVSEVYVGRMNLYGEHHPYANAAGIDEMLQATMDFENETGDLRYRHDTLMAAHGSVSFKRFNHITKEYLDVLGAHYTRLWHHDWGDGTVADSYNIDSQVTAAAIEGSSYGNIQFHSHGTPNSVIGVLHTRDVIGLKPAKRAGLIYAGACGVGTPAHEDNIMTALTRFVGLGMVGGTRSVSNFLIAGKPQKSQLGLFERVYWGQSNGEALYRMMSESAAYHGKIGQTNLKMNLLGDPSVVSMPDRRGRDLSVSSAATVLLDHEHGQPNTPVTKTYMVKNYGHSSATYTVAPSEAWATAIPASFALAPGESMQVAVSANAPASLSLGANKVSIDFSATNTPVVETRDLIVDHYLPQMAQYFPFERTRGLRLKSDTNTQPRTVSPAKVGNGLDINTVNKTTWMAETKSVAGGLKNFGVSFWVKLDAIADKRVVTAKQHWELVVEDGKFQMSGYNNKFTGLDTNGIATVSDSENVVAGRWYHFVMGIEPMSGKVTVWKDGKRLGSARLPDPGLPSGWDSLIEYGDKNIAGQVDEVRTFFKQITQSDVDDIYAGGWVMPLYPDHESVIQPEKVTLQWQGPVSADSYDVYSGSDLAAMSAADTDSAEFVGNTTRSQMTVTPAEGDNFWRVDVRTEDGTIRGLVSHYTVNH